MSAKSLAVLLSVAGCLLALGCGGSNRPATAPVEGRVTYNGKPLGGATVAFLCPGAPRPAVGNTDANGYYRLTTFQPNDGAVVGLHVVTVNVYSSEPTASLPSVDSQDHEAVSKAVQEAMRQSLRQSERAKNAPPALPIKYAHRTTSDLRKEVVRGKNVIDIDLRD